LFFKILETYLKTTNAIALSLLGMTLMPEPAFAQSPYDGLWDVVIQTKAGTCEPSLQYPVTIADGRISGAADVSGTVGREGLVKVSIRGAYANGQLTGNGGSGRWNGASAGIACSGRWQASRH
jgi:hypothetical protein